MSDGFSECWDSPAECPTASPSVGTARRKVRRLLRAFGQSGGMSDGFSERWDIPAECPTASPSVGTARRNVRQLLRAFGQSGGMSDGFSERWDSPAECPTARNSSIQSLRPEAGDFILRRSILHIVQAPPAHDRHAPVPDNVPDREKYGPKPHNGSEEPN